MYIYIYIKQNDDLKKRQTQDTYVGDSVENFILGSLFSAG